MAVSSGAGMMYVGPIELKSALISGEIPPFFSAIISADLSMPHSMRLSLPSSYLWFFKQLFSPHRVFNLNLRYQKFFIWC